MSSIIIQRAIIPHFKQDDYPGGIAAGVNEIGKLLALPPDEARARALDAEPQAETRHSSGNGFMLFFWLAILLFFVAPIMLAGVFGGPRYGRGRGRGPVVILGPGLGDAGGRPCNVGGRGGGGFCGGWGGRGGAGARAGWRRARCA